MPAVRPLRVAVAPAATRWQVASPAGAVRSYHQAAPWLAMPRVAEVVVARDVDSLTTPSRAET